MTLEEWVLFLEDLVLRPPSDEEITQVRNAVWQHGEANFVVRTLAFHQWLRRWHDHIIDWGKRVGYVKEEISTPKRE